MTQKITIANIEIKEGKSAHGDWKNYIFTAEDETRFSTKFNTFEHQASNLKVGDIIEAELKVAGKFTNLVSWQVVGHAEPTKPTPPQESMSKSDWADKDKTTRKSIERQKSLELAIELYIALRQGKLTPLNEVIALAQFFEHYLETGLNVGGEIVIPPPESPTVPSKEPTKGNLPEEPEKPSVVEMQGGKTSPVSANWFNESPDNFGWLKESLAILQREGLKAWSDANVLSYLNTVTRQKAKSIDEAVSRLSTIQAQAFKKRIDEAMERKF